MDRYFQLGLVCIIFTALDNLSIRNVPVLNRQATLYFFTHLLGNQVKFLYLRHQLSQLFHHLNPFFFHQVIADPGRMFDPFVLL
jgi:hypothetical protein